MSIIAKAATAVAALSTLALASPVPVNAFGTISGAGQNSEHGRITRRALTCGPESAAGTCFEQKTLDSLAGKSGTFGAVGAPDRGRGMLTSYAHCSSGDYLEVADYPRSKEEARVILTECRDYMAENMSHAVLDAADLLDETGAIRSREASMTFGCTYRGSQHGRAKCNILAHLGRIMHASQDFYSHSNWVDQPASDQAIGAKNPPGLGNRGAASWLDLRIAEPEFPDGLISGCFDNISFLDENRGCLYGETGDHRIRHANLNKDLGEIRTEGDAKPEAAAEIAAEAVPLIGLIGPGTTERGAMNDNFIYAVEAAIADTADKWATYRENLMATYGAERGAKMICIITHDDPVKVCGGEEVDDQTG